MEARLSSASRSRPAPSERPSPWPLDAREPAAAAMPYSQRKISAPETLAVASRARTVTATGTSSRRFDTSSATRSAASGSARSSAARTRETELLVYPPAPARASRPRLLARRRGGTLRVPPQVPSPRALRSPSTNVGR